MHPPDWMSARVARLLAAAGATFIVSAMLGQTRVAPRSVAAAPIATAPGDDRTLVAEKPNQVYVARQGETEANFTFRLTNMAASQAVITDVKTSCGCTVAKLPSKPWILGPLETGDLNVVVDLRGKSGTMIKTATVETQKGKRLLTLQITVPVPRAVSTDPAARAANMQLAQGDRQAVFKGDCVRCHVTPTTGLVGEPLFHAACGVCHEAEHRATMVPDLRTLPHETNRDFWLTMIVGGKPGTLMPGFSSEMDGPLSHAQIASLADYLAVSIPSHPEAAAPSMPAAAAAR